MGAENRVARLGVRVRSEWFIGRRASKLAAAQRETGLNFLRLEVIPGQEWRSKVLVISHVTTEVKEPEEAFIQVGKVSLDETSKEHKSMKVDPGKRQLLNAEGVVHLNTFCKFSDGKESKLLSMSLIPRVGGGVTMLRKSEGDGWVERSFRMKPRERLFVIANERSLTVKTGRLSDLENRGVRVPSMLRRVFGSVIR